MSDTHEAAGPPASRPGRPLTSGRRVGAIEVIALSDGRIELPLALFPDADPSETGPGSFPTSVNAYAIKAGGRTYLVDAGTGAARGGELGHVPAALALIGISPEAVDAVVMTHLHGDHVGGLRDAAGRAAFPRAELLIAEAEAAFWRDEGLPARSPERMQPTIAAARGAMERYADRMTCFAPNAEIAPGITTVALPGHTPGHTGLLVESEGEQLFIWADVVHVAAVQIPHPDWTIGFDVDGAAAVQSRRRAFDMAASERLPTAGMHLDFPGFGRLARSASGFVYEASAAL